MCALYSFALKPRPRRQASSDEKEYGEELCSVTDEGSGLDAHWNYIF